MVLTCATSPVDATGETDITGADQFKVPKTSLEFIAHMALPGLHYDNDGITIHMAWATLMTFAIFFLIFINVYYFLMPRLVDF
eukprot:8028483-Heterocapsa_arctica.AAC.1